MVVLGLMLPAPLAHALYSSTLTKEVAKIRQHVMASRERNGAGTLMNAIDKIVEQEKADSSRGSATAIAAKAAIAMGWLTADTATDLVSPCDSQSCYARFPYVAYLDPITMILFDFVWSTLTPASSCLRDDIFTLEAMKDAVTVEMVKAYLLYDGENGDKLWRDYNFLRNHAAFLKRYGNESVEMPKSVFDYRLVKESAVICDDSSSCRQPQVAEYYFGLGAKNQYAPENCQGEWMPAINQVVRSAKTFWTLFTAGGQSWNWGNLMEVAKARAKQRAAEWIRNNAITLTIAGSGGGGEPLFKGSDVTDAIYGRGGFSSPSLNRFTGYWATQGEIFMQVIQPAAPFFDLDHFESLYEMIALAVSSPFVGEAKREDLVQDFQDNYPESQCAFWNATDRVFRPCTKEQLESFEKGECRSCRDMNLQASPLTRVAEQQWRTEEAQEESGAAEKAFNYNFVLSTQSENAILDLDLALFEITGEIKRAYEGMGTGEKSLPTFCKQCVDMAERQCSNKHKGSLPSCK